MNPKNVIMLVDDDAEIREIVTLLLESEGFHVLPEEDGESAILDFSNNVSLLILDIMMPGMSGYQVCRKVREVSNIPILFLTAKNQDSDLTLGFSIGGDDYLSKPFSYTELLARVKGLLRRYQTYQGKEIYVKENPVLEWKGLSIRWDRNVVNKNGVKLDLTEKEYQLLRLMVRDHGTLFSAQNLYENVWGEPYLYSCNNTIMVHIRRLREKIEDDPQNPVLLQTVWGKGYRIV